jgi:IS66 Orf2 like protein
MIAFPSGARVWLATGHTDMRKGFDGLALLVQEVLRRDPHGGHLLVFRGRRGVLIKVLWHDGQGMCLFAKRLERGPLSLAVAGGRVGDDYSGATGIFAGRDRLAHAATYVAATGSGLSASDIVNQRAIWARKRRRRHATPRRKCASGSL